jgi:iron complex transport system permease protein
VKSVLFLALLLCLFLLLSFVSGPATPFSAWLNVVTLKGGLSGFISDHSSILELRVVHILLSCAVGFALATAGRTMQQLLQNPLADPHVTGLSAGSTSAVLLTLLFFPLLAQRLLFGWLPVLWVSAFIGAAGALSILNSLLFRLVRVWGAPALALAGLFLNASFSALLMVVFARLSPAGLTEVQSWTLGAIQPYGLNQALFLLPMLFIPSFYLMACERQLLLASFGQDFALTNGVNFIQLRGRILLCLMFLASAAVCAAGSIGFVGLLVPHLTRRWMLRCERPALRPIFNGLAGSFVLLCADLLSRTLTQPAELPVGVYTALLSFPFLVMVLLRHQKGAA